VWSFFQNCWHLKDWVKNDPIVPQLMKTRIIVEVEKSRTLAICNDMANGTKHLSLHRPHAEASYSHTQLTVSGKESKLECIIEVDGLHLIASVVAQECVKEWERILRAEGLPIEPMGT
jgi:hypothetical protein